MSEQLQAQYNPEQRINDLELAHIGALLVEASMRQDLDGVAAQHVENTGLQNPNSVGSTGIFVAGEVPMSQGNAYRQVGAEAVEDLASSGVVRNGATATGEQNLRWGDRVFWHPGDPSKKMQVGGRMVIEADKAAAEAGWVTAQDVKGVYARDNDGIIKNIIPQQTK